MDRRPPAAVVFDLGGVLLDWDPRHLYRTLFDDAGAMEAFLAEIDFYGWNRHQDWGRPFADAVGVLCAAFPQHTDLIRIYPERYQETIARAIEPTVAVLERLQRTGTPLYALTNFPRGKIDETRQRFPFLEHFADIVVSGEENVAKPDPRIYELLLQRAGRSASECVFIDDSAPNVEAAVSLGFDALQFTGADKLAAELRARHLPV